MLFFFFAGYLPDGREYQTLLDPLRTGRNPEIQILGLSEVRRFQVSLFEGQNFSFFPVCHQGRRMGGGVPSPPLHVEHLERKGKESLSANAHKKKSLLDRSRRRRVQRTRRKEKKREKEKNTKRGKTMRSGNKNKGRGTKKKSGRTRADTESTVYEKKGKKKREKEKKAIKRGFVNRVMGDIRMRVTRGERITRLE